MIFLRNISVGDNIVLAKIHRASFSDGWSESSFQNMLMDPTFSDLSLDMKKWAKARLRFYPLPKNFRGN